MNTHTPEPWIATNDNMHHTFKRAYIWQKGDELPDSNRIAIAAVQYNDEANAARIVACVNALAGLNPDAVLGLVAALREAVNWAEGYATVGTRNPPAFLDAARAALAKAEGDV